MLIDGGAGERLSSNCASGTYIVAGIGSRKARYTASATTPTISRGGCANRLPAPITTVLPSGLAPFRNFLTKAWLTRMTGGALFVSLSRMSRPPINAVPKVASHPGVIALKFDER